MTAVIPKPPVQPTGYQPGNPGYQPEGKNLPTADDTLTLPTGGSGQSGLVPCDNIHEARVRLERENRVLVRLAGLSTIIGLPESTIHELIGDNKIPKLWIDEHFLFYPDDVLDALRDIAREKIKPLRQR